MSVLDKYNKGNRFDFEAPEDFEFVKPKELYEDENENNKRPLKALFINNKSKFGDSAVAVTTSELVNLPNHMVEDVKEMMQDDEVIDLVNNDKVMIEIYTFNNKYGKCYGVKFEEIPF